jgi:hypothetical protein
VVKAERGVAFTFVVGGADDGVVEWSWTFRGHGDGTVVGQSWRLLRLDPVLGSTRADLNALRDYMAASAEKTLASLAGWITKNQVRQAPRRNRE